MEELVGNVQFQRISLIRTFNARQAASKGSVSELHRHGHNLCSLRHI